MLENEELDKFMQMRATPTPIKEESYREERESMIQLCKDWWNSPAGRECVKNAKTPSEMFNKEEK